MKKYLSKVSSERGSEVIQVLMVSAVFLVLIATVFYSQISGLMTNIFDDIDTWFTNNSSRIFMDVSN